MVSHKSHRIVLIESQLLISHEREKKQNTKIYVKNLMGTGNEKKRTKSSELMELGRLKSEVERGL